MGHVSVWCTLRCTCGTESQMQMHWCRGPWEKKPTSLTFVDDLFNGCPIRDTRAPMVKKHGRCSTSTWENACPHFSLSTVPKVSLSHAILADTRQHVSHRLDPHQKKKRQHKSRRGASKQKSHQLYLRLDSSRVLVPLPQQT